MKFFYDGQIRRYITQMVRLMSNFAYQDGKGQQVVVPVTYGDITRQVAHIIRDNSENKVPSVPRMGLYVTNLELDRSRLSDSSYVSKINVRERAYDEDNNEYLNSQGKNYTVERLMPTPYRLTVNVDIWTSNTEQKLQILEQIFMLFNPSLEIQTTDNYVDWASLSVVDLENINFSSRSIPVGTESEIDVASITFGAPIYISPPAKVKRLGVVQSVIASIFNEETGTIDLGNATPLVDAYYDTPKVRADISDNNFTTDTQGLGESSTKHNSITKSGADSVQTVTYQQFDLYIMDDIAKLVSKGRVGETSWRGLLEALPGTYSAGISEIEINLDDGTLAGRQIKGTVTLNPMDETQLLIDWDIDTLPQDTVIEGPQQTSGSVSYIIDPQTFDPSGEKETGIRLLLLNALPEGSNWQNADGNIVDAGMNDIIEWDGSSWNVIFESESAETTFVTNLNTGVQYKWTGEEWHLSYYGEFPQGTWRIVLG